MINIWIALNHLGVCVFKPWVQLVNLLLNQWRLVIKLLEVLLRRGLVKLLCRRHTIIVGCHMMKLRSSVGGISAVSILNLLLLILVSLNLIVLFLLLYIVVIPATQAQTRLYLLLSQYPFVHEVKVKGFFDKELTHHRY